MTIYEKLKQIYSGYWGETFRYVVIGGLTTVLSVGLFALLTKVLLWDDTLSNVISIIAAVIFAYAANKLFVFRTSTKTPRSFIPEAAKFFSGRAVTMLIEVFGVFFFAHIIGQDEVVGKIETQVIVVIGNYLISKFIVFRKTAK